MASKKVQVPLTIQEAEDLIEKLKALESFIYNPTNQFTAISDQTNTVQILLKKLDTAINKVK